MIIFNNDVKTILSYLTARGYEAYVVGGAVRNLLLGIEPHDYDITTNATPEEIIDIFSFTKTILTGIKYGTVTVIYNHEQYEITTYRIDGKYNDSRHPSNVKFSKTLDNDLMRRDFTVNALAYNDKLIDFHNGVDDIKNKIIRCIGNPDERFNEDALRILRAIRFACKLDFNIEEDTKKAIFKNKNLLKNIAKERINLELLEILKYKKINIIEEYFDVFCVVFPFLKGVEKKQIINKINNLFNNNCDEILVYCAFFVGLNENELKEILNNYKLSNKFKYLIKFLNGEKLVLTDKVIDYRKLLKKYSKNDIILYINYHVLIKEYRDKYIKLLIEADLKCNKIKDLNINGNDLLSLGITQNKIGYILDDILNLVIEDKIINRKHNLISYVKTQYLK